MTKRTPTDQALRTGAQLLLPVTKDARGYAGELAVGLRMS